MKKKVFNVIPIWALTLLLVVFISTGFAVYFDDERTYNGAHIVTGPATFSGATILSGPTTQSGLVTESAGSIRTASLVAATATLTTADCGSLVTIGHANEFTTTLPAATAGCIIEFYLSVAPSGSDYEVTTPGAADGDNIIQGSLVVDGTAVPCVDEDNINLVNSNAVIGDGFRVASDGTSWFLTGIGEASGSITCTSSS